MLKVKITYPSRTEEAQIMERIAGHSLARIQPVIGPEDVARLRQLVKNVYIDEKIKNYIVNLICATRDPEAYKLKGLKGLIMYGASPRATIYLNIASRAYAFMRGRAYVVPDDVKAMGLDVLRHRVTPTYEAEAEEKTSEDLVKMVFDQVEVP